MGRTVANASPEVRELYSGLILASSWKPMAVWNNIVSTFFHEHYTDPNEGMALFCGHLGERELTTLVKLVLKMGSPEFMLKRTGFLWSRYFSTGKFGAAQQEPSYWRLWLEAPADIEQTAGPLTCANGPAPWLERGLGLAGVEGTVRHLRCRYRGAPRCEFEARWVAT